MIVLLLHSLSFLDMNMSQDSGVKSFETYIKIWHSIISFLGVAPVTSRVNPRGELEFRVSLFKLVICAMAFASSFLTSYVQISVRKFDTVNLGDSLISGYVNLTGSFVMCIYVASVIRNGEAYAAFINSSLKFNKDNLTVRIKPILFLSVKFVALFIILISSCFCMDVVLYIKHDNFIPPTVLLCYISGFFTVFNISQFAVCCFWIREFLTGINKKFENSTIFMWCHALRPTVEFLKVNSVRSETLPKVDEIRSLRRSFHEIYVMSDNLKSIFNTRNLVTVANNFFMGTILTYCALNQSLIYSRKKSEYTFFAIINFSKWAFMSFLYIYGVIWPCTEIYAENERTVTLVRKYMAKATDVDIQAELQSFCMQLFLEKMNFSPHDFFSLDNKLILPIVGSVTSYLVVLIQFQISLI